MNHSEVIVTDLTSASEIPLMDLRRIHKKLSTEFKNQFNSVLEGNQYIGGPFQTEFEVKFALYHEVGHCVAFNSLENALKASLKSLGISQCNEVILPVNGSPLIVSVVEQVGAMPVFVDCLKETGLIDPIAILEAISAKTKAIVAVHDSGLPADMVEITKIAHQFNISTIEDASRATGAVLNGRKVGTFGDIGLFGFFPSDNLGALGNGGAIITKNEQLANQIKTFRNFFANENDFGLGMDAFQAAFLTSKLSHLDGLNAKRREVFQKYASRLSQIPDIKLANVSNETWPAWNYFPIRVANKEIRENLSSYLTSFKVSTSIPSISILDVYPQVNERKEEYPAATARQSLWLYLPLFPGMRDSEIEFVSKKIISFFQLAASTNQDGACIIS